MCSSTQPKMFGGAMPLGSGGNFSVPTTYQANAQPTANASAPQPPAPPSPISAAPGMAVAQNPAANPQPTVPGLNNNFPPWWQRMGGSLPPMGAQQPRLS